MGSELLRHRASLNDGHSPMPKPAWLGSAGRVVFVSDSKSSIERGTSWLLELPHGDSIDVLVSQLTREGFQEQAVAQRISSYQMQRLGLFNQGGFRATPSAPRVLTKVGQYQLSLQHFFDRGRSLVLVNEIQPFAKHRQRDDQESMTGAYIPMNYPLNNPIKRKQFGQSMVEYLVLASLIGIALALGKPSILEQLISALQTAYQGFAMAMSMP